MDIKPIRTKADYRAALAEIKRLFDAAPGTPEQFAKYMRSEYAKWTKVIQAAGIKVE